MSTTRYIPGTVVASTWLNDADASTYSGLTSVTGTNTITAVGPAGLQAYGLNQIFSFVPANANTGAVTINITPLGFAAIGTKAITKNGATALAAGDLSVGVKYLISYDGTQFQLLNASSAGLSIPIPVLSGGTGSTTAPGALTNLGAQPSATAVTQGGLQGQTWTGFTTAGTTLAYTLTPTPAIAANTANTRFRVKFNAANTTTTPTLAVSGQTALPLKVYDSSGTLQSPAVGRFSANLLTDVETDGTNWIVLNPTPATSGLTSLGVIATTSGTVASQTGIPASAKRITIVVSSVSTNGSSEYLVRIGSGSFVSTGYSSQCVRASGTGGDYNTSTVGFLVTRGPSAATIFYGQMVLMLADPSTNTWVMSGQLGSLSVSGEQQNFEGVLALGSSTILDRVQLTTTNGTDTFDNGSITVFVE